MVANRKAEIPSKVIWIILLFSIAIVTLLFYGTFISSELEKRGESVQSVSDYISEKDITDPEGFIGTRTGLDRFERISPGEVPDSELIAPETCVCNPGQYYGCVAMTHTVKAAVIGSTTGSYMGRKKCNNNCISYGVCEQTEFCGDSIVNGPESSDNRLGCAVVQTTNPAKYLTFAEGVVTPFSVPFRSSPPLKASDLCVNAGWTRAIYEFVSGGTYKSHFCTTPMEDFDILPGKAYAVYTPTYFSENLLLSGKNPSGLVSVTFGDGSNPNYFSWPYECWADFDYLMEMEGHTKGKWLHVSEIGITGLSQPWERILTNTPTTKQFNYFEPGKVYEVNMSSGSSSMIQLNGAVAAGGGPTCGDQGGTFCKPPKTCTQVICASNTPEDGSLCCSKCE